jgi:hypothetical protein
MRLELEDENGNTKKYVIECFHIWSDGSIHFIEKSNKGCEHIDIKKVGFLHLHINDD